MANKWRVLFLFEGLHDGWSEGHVFDANTTNGNDLVQPMKNIMVKRALMLGNEYRGIGMRIRLVQDQLGNPVKRAAKPVLQQFLASGAADNAGDPDFVACLGVGSDVTGQHSTRVFLGGIPDATSGAGGTVNGALPVSNAYLPAFTNWAAALAGQTLGQGGPIIPGYFRFPIITTLQVTNYVSSVDDVVTYTVGPGDVDPTLIGTILKARVSRLNNSRSLLNREQLVFISGVNTITTMQSRAAGKFTGIGQMILYPTIPSFVAVTDWQLSAQVARHKRGRPFSRSRGRQPALPKT